VASGPLPDSVAVELPRWVAEVVDAERRYDGDEERMRVAVRLASENVARGTGGPFGAVIFDAEQGTIVAAGVNRVTPLGNSVLHAEVVALMLAQRRVRSFTLDGPGLPRHELVTSCEPCAMCLGAAFSSGVRRLVCGAAREDATTVGFDEGPVFAESYAYLEARGIAIERGVLRAEAREVLERYRLMGGAIYNP
jgi:tRNA(Arg) A34 adenosine deaminase TadA